MSTGVNSCQLCYNDQHFKPTEKIAVYLWPPFNLTEVKQYLTRGIDKIQIQCAKLIETYPENLK